MKTNGVNVGFVFPLVPTRPPTPVPGDYSLILLNVGREARVYAKAVTTILGHNFLLFFIPVCKSRVDLGILVDVSRSIMRKNFRKVIDFLKSLVSFFPLSTRGTRVGLVVFHSRAQVVFGFNRYGSRAQVVRVIGRLRCV